MLSAHSRFAANIGRAKDLRALFLNLNAGAPGVLDLTDILRASVVAAVSAFDTFVHEITVIGMVETFMAARPMTDAFGRFPVSMGNVLALIASNPGDTNWLESEIRGRHGWLSFQHPDKVADAIRNFCDKELWKEVGARLGIDPGSARNRLALVVDRRNKIAHEADMDPTSPGSRWPIDHQLTQEVISTIEGIGNAIFQVVTTP
jgi:hypothetical protein